MSRILAAATLLLATTAGLAACTSEPEPEPQWTEESAYAAAEETFREYWAAGAKSIDDRAKYLTESMQEVDRAGVQELEELGVRLRGASVVLSTERVDFREVGETTVVELIACIDGSNVEVQREDGSWSNPRSDTVYQVEAQLEATLETMLLADLTESVEDQC